MSPRDANSACYHERLHINGVAYVIDFKCKFNGAPTRTRTADLLITNQLLYQLSYRGERRWRLRHVQRCVSCNVRVL
jgi:hypothetical protein